MKLSQFFQQLSVIKEDFDLWSLHLAEPEAVEGEGTYVRVAPLSSIEVDQQAAQVRFIPRLGDHEPQLGPSVLAVALESLPNHAGGASDFTLMGRLPLVELPRERKQRSLVEIDSLHVGMGSQEAWLLVRPLAEYPADELPT